MRTCSGESLGFELRSPEAKCLCPKPLSSQPIKAHITKCEAARAPFFNSYQPYGSQKKPASITTKQDRKHTSKE